MKMDSDEELESVDAILSRLKAFEAFPDSHIIVANELKPAGLCNIFRSTFHRFSQTHSQV